MFILIKPDLNNFNLKRNASYYPYHNIKDDIL